MKWEPVPLGKAAVPREGNDVTLVSVGVGVHCALEAADSIAHEGVSAGVLDLRTVSPLDEGTLCDAVARTRRLLVVDEDYERFGLSGELAALCRRPG
jgi:pyruvate dehydrogenase E1 component beta subunit